MAEAQVLRIADEDEDEEGGPFGREKGDIFGEILCFHDVFNMDFCQEKMILLEKCIMFCFIFRPTRTYQVFHDGTAY